MSKRRAPFKERIEHTRYGTFEVAERTGTPRYVTFVSGWRSFGEQPVYHVVRRTSRKVSNRPRRLIRPWSGLMEYGMFARGQWRYRGTGVGTVCGRSTYTHEEGIIHDRVSPTDVKCFDCFGPVPGARLPKRRRFWR